MPSTRSLVPSRNRSLSLHLHFSDFPTDNKKRRWHGYKVCYFAKINAQSCKCKYHKIQGCFLACLYLQQLIYLTSSWFSERALNTCLFMFVWNFVNWYGTGQTRVASWILVVPWCWIAFNKKLNRRTSWLFLAFINALKKQNTCIDEVQIQKKSYMHWVHCNPQHWCL